jgi:hypothetical protein
MVEDVATVAAGVNRSLSADGFATLTAFLQKQRRHRPVA